MQETLTEEILGAHFDALTYAVKAIHECGEAGMPSGTLYAVMLNRFASVAHYDAMIALLVRVKAITQKGHLLVSTLV